MPGVPLLPACYREIAMLPSREMRSSIVDHHPLPAAIASTPPIQLPTLYDALPLRSVCITKRSGKSSTDGIKDFAMDLQGDRDNLAPHTPGALLLGRARPGSSVPPTEGRLASSKV